MRFLTILLLLLATLPLHAADIPELHSFAEKYWQAIKSQDAKQIFALYDPKVFTDLSSEEATFMKNYWMKEYSNNARQQGDSYEIETKKLPADNKPYEGFRWADTPEYQFQIETFRSVAVGKEGLTVIVEMTILKDGKFLIVRPVPSADEVKKAMRKKDG